jgi:hypothetical protein
LPDLITAGVELSRARQRRGLSVEQISQRTKIPVEWLTAIEQARFDELSDEISLRGYLRLFAQEVGLDPRDVSERYIAQLQDWAPLEEFADESGQPDFPFISVSEPDDVDSLTSELPDVATTDVPPAFGPPLAAAARSSARPVPYAALLMVALIALTAGFWTFTRYTEHSPTAIIPETIRETREAPPRAPAPVTHPEEPRIAQRDAVAIPSSTGSRPRAAARVERRPARATAPSAAENLSGWWVVTNRIEQSNLDSFNDLTLDFRLQLDQNGNRVRGQGVKWKENGRTVGARARRPISVDGTIEEGRLALTFTEQGMRRTSHGSFEMQLAEDGSLHGRFSSDAAQSSGSSQAVRMQ